MLETRSPEMKKAVGVLKELSADERTRMLYEQREKARRDFVSIMDGARQEGMQEGMQKGRQEGMQEGIQEGMQKGKITIARNLLGLNLPFDQIATATGLTIEEIKDLSVL